MSTAKQTLKGHLEWRVNSLVNDSNTFLWAKSVNGGIFFKQKGVGGGNFLIILGCFACLNLISKIYWILSKDSKCYLSENAKEDFQINEIDAFVNLVFDLYKDGINLGLGKDRKIIARVWDDMRNKLSHLAAPGGGQIGASSRNYTKKKKLVDIVKMLKKKFEIPFFIKQNNEVIVHADLLNQYLRDINNWLLNKVDNSSDEKANDGLKELNLL